MKRIKVEEEEPIWIPNELIYNIFLYLDLKTLLKCRLVCKRFKEIQDEDCFVNEYFKPYFPFETNVRKCLELYKKKGSFEVKPRIGEEGNVKLNLTNDWIHMNAWDEKIKQSDHGEISIERNFIELYLPMYKYSYKFILYSRVGFSWYSIFCEMEHCQRIGMVDYNENHERVYRSEGYFDEVKKGISNPWVNNSMHVDNEGICDSLHLDGNKLIKTFCHS